MRGRPDESTCAAETHARQPTVRGRPDESTCARAHVATELLELLSVREQRVFVRGCGDG